MVQTETTTERILTPQQLAKRLGLSPKATRQLLHSEYPQGFKNQRWQISEMFDRKVQRDYKAKIKVKSGIILVFLDTGIRLQEMANPDYYQD